jgi:hypothetical protein
MAWTTGSVTSGTIGTGITIGITVAVTAVTASTVAIVTIAIAVTTGTVAIRGGFDPEHTGATRKPGGAYGSGCVSQSGDGDWGRPGG